MIPFPSHPRRSAGAWVERKGGRYLLHDGQGATVVTLNESALALWELCDGETATDEMVEAVRAAAGVAWEQASRDVSETIERLSRAGLVEQ